MIFKKIKTFFILLRKALSAIIDMQNQTNNASNIENIENKLANIEKTQTLNLWFNNLYFINESYSFICSQYGQDIFVCQYFKNKHFGMFLELGGYDGVNQSNTYFLQNSLMWSGILIEPIKEYYEQMVENRSQHNDRVNLITLNCAISTQKDNLILEKMGMESRNNALPPKKITSSKYEGLETVQTTTLANVFEEHRVSVLDYVSIDTEGTELDVLESINFERVHINILGIEIFQKNVFEEIRSVLEQQNFIFIRFIGHDAFFENKTQK